MKFAISLLLLSVSTFASPIKIYHEDNVDHAVAIKDTLTQGYFIPEDLMSLQVARRCEDLIEGGKLDLCLKNNGDLIVVSVDREFVNESLKVFRAP